MEARSVIEVVEYDEAWPVRAAAARADLISLGVFDAVEHIGSTSVPGPAAKPAARPPARSPGRRPPVRRAEAAARGGAHHGTEYTKAKPELIQELTDRARADRGLPSVSVWEE